VIPGPLPPTFDGRRVEWDRWEPLLPIICPKARGRLGYDEPCTQCGAAPGAERVTYGTVTPFSLPEQVRRTGGRMLQEPSHPIKRLMAFGCTACGTALVMDRGWTGDAWREVLVEQPGLFPIDLV
jgi:hypothetical protein